MSTLVSPISFDLGAINTGVTMTHHWKDSTKIEPIIGETIIVEPGKIRLGLKTRTIKRHTERNYKRRKMAKRLLWVILREAYSIDSLMPTKQVEQKKFEEAVSGLLNRRGFTFLSDEEEDGPTVGSKPREKYLADIEHDVTRMWDSTFSTLKNTPLTPQVFARLVGHISNLELKCLRKYFNTTDFLENDHWNNNRFLKIYSRYLRGWHVKKGGEEHKHTNRLELLKLCQPEASILDIWTTHDAVMSIPPYEDQNNRHPPKCRSAILNPTALSNQFPTWKEWVLYLIQYENEHANNFFANYSFSHLKKDSDYARCLQLIFDRSKDSDSISLRDICSCDTPSSSEGYQTLNQRLGNATSAFCACAKAYFRECNAIIKGHWVSNSPANLLTLCNTNPPQKSKIAPQILSTLLGITFDETSKNDLLRFLKETKLKNKTLIGLASDCADAQKVYGISFKEEYANATEAYKSSSNKNEKLLWNIKTYISDAALKLVHYLHPEDSENIAKTRSYHSPYIWAQMYNILEGDSHGFSHTCRACTEDNRFRSATYKTRENGSTIANAKRLPGDSKQPFDGMVARLMKHIGVAAAKKKAEHLKTWLATNAISDTEQPITVEIPVAIEENRFDFTDELSKLKKNDGYTPKQASNSDNTAKRWESKETRIKSDGGGICPYCGKPITTNGHIDHIIPRSLSLERYGTIFNSEANLIFSHAECNTQKHRELYTLQQLSPNYLNAVFGTSNIAAIEEKLVDSYNILKSTLQNLISGFVSMTSEERNVIRHLLFVTPREGSLASAIRDNLIQDLCHLNKAFVNGTQRWMVRYFRVALEQNIKENHLPIKPLVYPILFSAEEIHATRLLVNQEKQHPQPVFSHVIDAALVMGHCLMRQKAFQDTSFNTLDEERDFYARLIPEEFSINALASTEPYNRPPQSTTIFKDSIYGTKYLSLIVDKQGRLMAGFSPKNAVALTTKTKDYSKIYQALSPFLRQDKRALPNTFEEVTNRIRQTNTPFICPIDATAANTFLHNIANHHTTEKTQLLQADLLDDLCFFSQKVDVVSTIIDDKCLGGCQKTIKKSLLNQFVDDPKKVNVAQYDEILAELSHTDWAKAVETIRATLLTIIKKKLTIKFNNRELTHPAWHEWETFILKLPHHLLWKNTTTVASEWKQLKQELLATKKMPNALQHHKSHTDFSLPLLCNVSGGFRIRRKTPQGNTVWQTLSIAEFAIGGFSTDGHQLDSKKAILQPHLRQKNVSSIKGRAIEIQQRLPLDAWREIPLEAISPNAKNIIKSLRIAPGSESRRNIRIALQSAVAEEIFNIHREQFCKLERNVAKKFNTEKWKHYPELKLVKPRDGKPIYLIAFGRDYLVLAYTSEQNTQQTALYNQGTPISNK